MLRPCSEPSGGFLIHDRQQDSSWLAQLLMVSPQTRSEDTTIGKHEAVVEWGFIG
jgi:hypothetical protein